MGGGGFGIPKLYVKFWWPLFLAMKFTFLFLNLGKIQFFTPKGTGGGGPPVYPTSRLWSFNESCYRSWVSADPSWKVGSVWEPTGGQVPATAYSPHNYPLTCCQKENTPHNHPVTFYQKQNTQLSTNMLSKRKYIQQPSNEILSKIKYTTIH